MSSLVTNTLYKNVSLSTTLFVCFSQVMVHGHDLAVLVAKGFARLDTNHDGILEMNEYEAVLKRDDSNGRKTI